MRTTYVLDQQKQHLLIRRRRPERSVLFLLLSTFVVLAGALTTLLWQELHTTHADAALVVGAPTLSAATVNGMLTRLGSPMAGAGVAIEENARRTNIDDAFALAVWWAETNDGAAGVGLDYRNPGGVRSSGAYPVGGGSYTIYPSYTTAVADWFDIVKGRYVNRGLTSVYSISGPYVGTSGAGNWANKVVNLMARYRAEAPPIATPTPSPTPKPRDWEQEQHPAKVQHPAHQQKVNAAGAKAQPQQLAIAKGQQQPKSVAASVVPTQPTAGNKLLTIAGLLVALILAAWGLFIRRSGPTVANRSSQDFPVTTALALDTFEAVNAYNLPPLYVNEFSPLAQQDFSPVEQIFFASVPPTPVIPPTPGSGLFPPARRTELGLRRTVLKPSSGQTEQLADLKTEPHPSVVGGWPRQQETEGLVPYQSGLTRPRRHILEPVGERAAEKVGSASGGLLRRYRDNPNEKHS